jgi:hypothetical protein
VPAGGTAGSALAGPRAAYRAVYCAGVSDVPAGSSPHGLIFVAAYESGLVQPTRNVPGPGRARAGRAQSTSYGRSAPSKVCEYQPLNGTFSTGTPVCSASISMPPPT